MLNGILVIAVVYQKSEIVILFKTFKLQSLCDKKYIVYTSIEDELLHWKVYNLSSDSFF